MHDLDRDPWPPGFLVCAERAARQSLNHLGNYSPLLAKHISPWLATRCDILHPESYFTAPAATPILALPWWLELRIRGEIDAAFQTDLMYSSINAYYFVRLLDDIMDGHGFDRAALPALHPFHFWFSSTYAKYFPPDHPFWREFERMLMTTAEAVTVDSTLVNIQEADFLRASARKFAAGAIPIAAVSFHYERAELLPAWENFFELFARWQQTRDDVLDWSGDLDAGRRSWLLCEAERRRVEDEGIAEWMGREGFQWANSVLERCMEEALTAAAGLDSPELVAYLNLRRDSFSRHMNFILETAAACSKLLQLETYPSPE
jgi:hypothetical protein